MDSIKIDSTLAAWRKTAKSRLRFELTGLAFAHQRGFSPEDYARHLWAKGSLLQVVKKLSAGIEVHWFTIDGWGRERLPSALPLYHRNTGRLR